MFTIDDSNVVCHYIVGLNCATMHPLLRLRLFPPDVERQRRPRLYAQPRLVFAQSTRLNGGECDVTVVHGADIDLLVALHAVIEWHDDDVLAPARLDALLRRQAHARRQLRLPPHADAVQRAVAQRLCRSQRAEPRYGARRLRFVVVLVVVCDELDRLGEVQRVGR